VDILDVVFVVVVLFIVVVLLVVVLRVVLFVVVVLEVVVLSVVLFVVVVVLLVAVAVVVDVEVVLVADDEVPSVVVLCVEDFVKLCVLLVLLSVAVTVLFVDVGVLLITVLLSSAVLSCDVLSSGVLIVEMVNVLPLSDPKEFVLPMCELCPIFADMSIMFSWLKVGMILKVSFDVAPRSGVSFEWLLPSLLEFPLGSACTDMTALARNRRCV